MELAKFVTKDSFTHTNLVNVSRLIDYVRLTINKMGNVTVAIKDTH
jgi:hypothetical protein